MLIYIIKKIFSFFLLLFLLSIISFAIVYFSPDPRFNDMAFMQAYSLFYQQIIFDQQMIAQYSLWNIVSEIILPTFELCIFAIIGSIIIGLPVGIIAGLTRSNTLNYLIKFVCLILYASPIAWLTVVVISSISNDWFFVQNEYYQPTISSSSIINILLMQNIKISTSLVSEFTNLALPIMILMIQPSIIAIQLISERVSNTAQKNYIKVANIRENSTLKVLIRHLLPNAIPRAIPQLTYNITTLLFSTMVVEILLDRAGLGTWVYSAFHQSNYIIIAIAIFCCGTLISLLTLLSEIFVVLCYPIQSRSLYE